MQFKRRTIKRTQLSLDITPLIDVIFLLLIFFMISTTFIMNPGIKINLPEANAKAKSEKPKYIELVITKKSEYYVNNKKFARNNLKSALSAVKKQTKLDNLVIKADGKVRHEEVVFAMDQAKQVGLKKLSIATQPKSDS